MEAYQIIFIDIQQLNYTLYKLTERHFSSEEAWKRQYHRDNPEAEIMFKFVGAFEPSKLTGDMAEIVTQHEAEFQEETLITKRDRDIVEESAWGKEEARLFGQGRRLSGNPTCVRCGRKNLSFAFLAIAGGGQEVTYCLGCAQKLLDNEKEK